MKLTNNSADSRATPAEPSVVQNGQAADPDWGGLRRAASGDGIYAGGSTPRLTPAWLTGSRMLIAAVFVFALIFASATVRRVDPGFAGVVVDYGRGTAGGKPAIASLQSGRYVFVNPITQRVAEYPIGQQTLTMVRRDNEGQVRGDDSVACQDNSGIPLYIDSSTLWRVDPEHVGELYLLRPGVPLSGKEGADISSLVVRREVRNAITMACGLYRYDEILGKKKAEFMQVVADTLRPNLRSVYIDLDKFFLGEIHLNPDQQNAINQKAKAEQEALQSAFLRQKAENEAAAAVAKAEGDQKVKVLNAQGEAEAIRIVNQQLSDSQAYIEYVKWTKRDGKMPQVTGGQPLLSVPLDGASSQQPAAKR